MPVGEGRGEPVRRREYVVVFCLLAAAGVGLHAAFGAAPDRPRPVQITHGPGSDTEAAWSPQGAKIVYQSERNGGCDLYVLDLGTGKSRPVVKGKGYSCFPAWSPDAKWIVYSHAVFDKTAFERPKDGYNIFVVSAGGGEPRRLTSGRFRDYTPTFSRDGRAIYFSSTRNTENKSVGISTVPFSGGELRAARAAIPNRRGDSAVIQPDLSFDGRLLAYGYIHGFRSNWAIRLAKMKDLSYAYPLTDMRDAFYAPRWSPRGRIIACTAYRAGDSGWNIWLLNAETRERARLTSGPGNSRSPSWSPDGKEIVFENNQSGRYKLYRAAVPDGIFKSAGALQAYQSPPAVLRLSFAERAEGKIPDLSGSGNEGEIHGKVKWEGPAISFPSEGAYVAAPTPRKCDFGTGAFSVTARVLVPSHDGAVRMICAGDYPGNRQGWQLFVGRDNKVHFNSRDAGLKYVGAFSDDVMPLNRIVTLAGERLDSGLVRLYVNGALQRRVGRGASCEYGRPTEVRVGCLYSGGYRFNGRVYDVAIYAGALTDKEARGRSLADFWMY